MRNEAKISLDYTELPGAVSKRALEEHFKLYEGYKKLIDRNNRKLISTKMPDTPAVDTDYAQAMRNQSFGVSAAYLHELFFQNVNPNPDAEVSPELMDLIEEHYSNLESCIDEIKSAAISARGWSVLAYKPIDNAFDLRVFGVDSHEIGNVFGYIPLVVIDVWEHAYWMDFGTSKAKYVDNICKYIDWKTVSGRFKK